MNQAPTASLRTGLIFGLSAFLLWGFAPAYWKLLGHVSPLELIAHRVVWAALIYVFVAFAFRMGPDLWAAARSPSKLSVAALATFLIGVNWVVFVWAVLTNRVLEVSLGYFMNPVMTMALGVFFFGERMSRAQKLAALFVVLGVAVRLVSVGRLPWVSVSLALTFAAYGGVRKRASLSATLGAALETFILAPFAFTYLTFLALSGEMTFLAAGWDTDLLLFGCGAVTLVPLLLFAAATRRLPLVYVGFLQYLAPTCQFLLAVFAYDEPFTALDVASFGSVWVACALLVAAHIAGLRKTSLKPL